MVACKGGEDESHTHTMSYVEAKEASCTESGMTAYYAVNYDGNSLLMFLCRLSARSSPLTYCYIQQKNRSEYGFFVVLVPKAGLEPARCCHQRILSPPRLPFHHFGKLLLIFYHIMFPLASVSAYLVRFYPIFLSPFRPFHLLQRKFRKLHLAMKI